MKSIHICSCISYPLFTFSGTDKSFSTAKPATDMAADMELEAGTHTETQTDTDNSNHHISFPDSCALNLAH